VSQLAQIRADIVELSGSGKKVAPNARRHGIYCSFTLPGLDDMRAVRDTKTRYEDFKVPMSLEGKTFLDVGSNVGATIFEAARRGANVTGVEFRQDRVDLCHRIAQLYGTPQAGPLMMEMREHESIGRAKFYVANFNAMHEHENDPWNRPVHDVVWCCSVDTYIDDRAAFYAMLRSLCRETLYFESNVQRGFSELDAIRALKDAGFDEVHYLGNGHSGGISRKRKLYRATISQRAPT
jgi:2-polyprenyl-3-methyl-5-hydroxy-6-metoxy-1,4-benzoquinol methylase